ncbi:hypothetical protein [Curtobacterium sp. PhB130]|uniref:hypothetical protein n=1 Tax=Curtobacterium sp. PhB130 TaxID=2485178 RepID=UPI001611DB55|nr:hypothetical protein [Curtobacterium sp. PhB130]
MRARRRSPFRHALSARIAAVAVTGVVALGGLLAVPTAAIAAPTLHLDQSSGEAGPGGMAAVAQASQTFVAGSNGALAHVEIYEYWYGWANQTLSIYPVTSSGSPNTSVAPLAVTPVSTGSGYGWVTADFAQPARLVAGTKYALVRNGPGQVVAGGNPYPAGNPNVGGGDYD